MRPDKHPYTAHRPHAEPTNDPVNPAKKNLTNPLETPPFHPIPKLHTKAQTLSKESSRNPEPDICLGKVGARSAGGPLLLPSFCDWGEGLRVVPTLKGFNGDRNTKGSKAKSGWRALQRVD